MTVSIRDRETDQLARRLAREHRTTITEVVRRGLLALDRQGPPAGTPAARAQAARTLLLRVDALAVVDPRGSGEVLDDLYGPDGMPG